ncbi:MAG: hypothetical protein E7355_00985 [Clostridiales bacterium]|nr:hypothetical protein [Clostridiales bacterium]
MKNKIETYLGFCVRARQIVFGVDEIAKQRKSWLLIIDNALGDNSQKEIQKARERLRCPLLVVEDNALGALLHKGGVKAVSIKDQNLASAILSVAENEPQFKLYSGGTN